MVIKNNSFVSWLISNKTKKHHDDSKSENVSTDSNLSIDSENFLIKLKHKLQKTSQQIGIHLINLIRASNKIDKAILNEIEDHLLMADVGINLVNDFIKDIKHHLNYSQSSNDIEIIHRILKEKMIQILQKVEKPLKLESHQPFIILIIGVNGTGKTTTIAKMAHLLQYQKKKSVMLAAADTFRVGAIEQLKLWGQMNQIPVISKHRGADSASVIFDAIKSAQAKHIDVLIADTAGRLQNKVFLMEELKKIIRIIKKIDKTAPHEVMLILDATIGQNSINQVKFFHEAAHVTGLTLTKLDGTAKGGILLNIANTFEIPIRYIGIGEHLEDFQCFNSNNFIKAIF
ncbi:MAG: signal recognition particle-docking protein FtsY [Candidatus Dasytiphilus stammeri]